MIKILEREMAFCVENCDFHVLTDWNQGKQSSWRFSCGFKYKQEWIGNLHRFWHFVEFLSDILHSFRGLNWSFKNYFFGSIKKDP